MTMRDGDAALRKQWFRAKLAAEKQKTDVVKKLNDGTGNFVILDVRDRASYRAGHIPGAISMPLEGIEKVAETLRPEIEYVTYCWNAT